MWNNIFIPFWLWINQEPIYFVLVGNSEKRAQQLLEDLRAEFEANPRIHHDFGDQKNPGSWEDGFFVTGDGFIGQGLGMGQSVRGLRVKEKRPTHIVVDDIETKDVNKNPKRQDEWVKWIEKDLIPTMDGPFRRFIQSNNLHSPRMIQSVLQARHPKWKTHNIKAYNKATYTPVWPSKYDATYYKKLEEEIGVLAALAEYNNEPHVEGKIFHNDQIQWAKLPRLNHFKIIVGHWDIAYAGTPTADYNAVRIWGLYNNNFYYIDGFLKQCKMKEAVAFICFVQASLPESVIIHWRYEAQFWNDEVKRTIREVRDAYNIRLNLLQVQTPKTRKYDRILSLQPYYQNERIYYNEKKKSHPDTQLGIAQLLGIEPNYKSHDDAPDADQQAIGFLEKHISCKDSDEKYRTGKMKRIHIW